MRPPHDVVSSLGIYIRVPYACSSTMTKIQHRCRCRVRDFLRLHCKPCSRRLRDVEVSEEIVGPQASHVGQGAGLGVKVLLGLYWDNENKWKQPFGA